MYHVSAQGVDERMINVHYYYKESYFPYRNVKSISEPEQYLSAIEIYCFRVGLCQLRLGVLPINNNLHRYSACAIQRNCLFCVNAMRTKSTCCSLVPCIMTLGRNLWTIRLKRQSRLHWKMFFPGKTKQICFNWPSLFTVLLGVEKNLRGETSFTI